MEIANASVSPAIHIARALGVLSIEASLATSLACSLRWSTSCLTFAEELAGSPICVASASCCNSGMLGGVCARQSHHIAHPRYSAGQVRIQTFFPNQSLFISFVVLLAQWSNLEEGSWMFFSIYHHYGPYGQIDVVRIIVCPFEKDECPTHVISAKGFVSEVNSLLVFTFGHQESRTDSLALLCKGLTSDVWKYVVEVNSSEMQPEGNLSFDPVCIWLWFRYRLKTFFRALISVEVEKGNADRSLSGDAPSSMSEPFRNWLGMGVTIPALIQPGSIDHVPFPPCLGASLALREKARHKKKSFSSRPRSYSGASTEEEIAMHLAQLARRSLEWECSVGKHLEVHLVVLPETRDIPHSMAWHLSLIHSARPDAAPFFIIIYRPFFPPGYSRMKIVVCMLDFGCRCV
ncbi:hypothetical protein D0Y65_048471 [Glycine soja]|uniref:Uncharacterized protein n=1 Tax=Glycine soja TaxID=3848 RepID=A0A445FT23_GLYSO|nr:hypothetical protein D0Y65_048471 [Glycine soja]